MNQGLDPKVDPKVCPFNEKVNFIFGYRPILILDISKKYTPGHLVECSNDRTCVFSHDSSLADLSDAIIICLSTLCQSEMEVIK